MEPRGADWVEICILEFCQTSGCMRSSYETISVKEWHGLSLDSNEKATRKKALVPLGR